MTELNMLFALLRSVIFEQEIGKEIISPLDGEKLEKIYKISEKHDLPHRPGATGHVFPIFCISFRVFPHRAER